jgi:2'-5' RNA ligase
MKLMQAGYKKGSGSPPDMKRIFIAVKVMVGDKLSRMISSMKSEFSSEGINWTAYDNIHITLAFLGDTEANKIKNITSMLSDLGKTIGKFELTLRGTGVFKNIHDPRILWTGIDPSESLMELNRSIIGGLKELGYKIEERPFNPHLTIARIKYFRNKVALEKLLDIYKDMLFQKAAVDEVILYESILLPKGPVYKPLARFNLH